MDIRKEDISKMRLRVGICNNEIINAQTELVISHIKKVHWISLRLSLHKSSILSLALIPALILASVIINMGFSFLFLKLFEFF